MNTDTIAAIATALSDSGIGIIRVSGDAAIETADKLFRTPGGKKILTGVESHTIHYGYIVDFHSGQKIDEVMVSVMRAPKSFTSEDTVEINCHGGVFVMKRILDLVCEAGARMAEPGEFTKRAFLNGRIDLSKAEAVMDFIHSQNEYALQNSFNQLQGKLTEVIRELRENLIYEIAFIESALDDPEHFDLAEYPQKLEEKIVQIREKISRLIDTSLNGKLITEGVSTVILGKPNAGKSSLLNQLLGEERAIVTSVAGTTRDVLQEKINLNGVCLNIVDTAGIHDTEDIVEKIGVEKAKKYAQDADLLLCVVDGSVDLDESDRVIFSMIQNKKAIILLNKNDLDKKVEEEDLKQFIDFNHNDIVVINTSTKDGSGIRELEAAIKKMFYEGVIKSNNEIVITNLRHKKSLEDAYGSLGLVLKSIEEGMPEDFYSIDLMSAYSSLGYIIGEEVDDDLMNEIFSKFCMGK